MFTVPEVLRHDVRPGQEVAVVLRSGVQITGAVVEVDLATNSLRLGSWAIRLDEVAGVCLDLAAPDPAVPHAA